MRSDPGRPVVLLVDNEPDFADIARQILEEGEPAFAVHVVLEGTQALAFLERRAPYANAPRPAFVILDHRLDDFDAPEVLVRLRAREHLRRLPVLVMSVTPTREFEAAALGAGADRFCGKPYPAGAFRDAVVAFWKEVADGRDGDDSRQ